MEENLDEKEILKLFDRLRVLVRAREFDSALDMCHNLFNEWPKSGRHYLFGRLAYICEQMRDLPAALRALDEAILLQPNSSAYLDHRMVIANRMGKFDLSIDDATKLIALERCQIRKSFTESAHVYRAFALIKLGRPDEALHDLLFVADQGPFRFEGKSWSMRELLELAEAAKPLGD